MKKLLLIAGLALAMSSVGAAAPLCTDFAPAGSAVDKSLNGINNAGGCLIGHLLFNDFVVINNGGFSTVNVGVGAGTGTLVGYTAVFAFSVNTTPGQAPPGGGDIILQYSVTGANQIGASLEIGTASNVTITEDVCSNPYGGLLGTTCEAPPASNYNLNVSKPAPPGTTTASVSFDPLNVTYIQKDIAFGNGGSISDFVNGHTAVPEPTTSLLMGTALLGLALLRKRFNQK